MKFQGVFSRDVLNSAVSCGLIPPGTFPCYPDISKHASLQPHVPRHWMSCASCWRVSWIIAFSQKVSRHLRLFIVFLRVHTTLRIHYIYIYWCRYCHAFHDVSWEAKCTAPFIAQGTWVQCLATESHVPLHFWSGCQKLKLWLPAFLFLHIIDTVVTMHHEYFRTFSIEHSSEIWQSTTENRGLSTKMKTQNSDKKSHLMTLSPWDSDV